MIDQGSRYHTMCAKLPPADAEKPELIDKIKVQFKAEHVFRGPRMDDGRVRVIFQVPAQDSAKEFINKLKKQGITQKKK